MIHVKNVKLYIKSRCFCLLSKLIVLLCKKFSEEWVFIYCSTISIMFKWECHIFQIVDVENLYFNCYESLKDVLNVSMEVYFSNLSPLVSPPGAEGEAEPAAGRHLPRRRGMCPIYLQTRVDVLLLQRIQAQHPLHDPLRRRGVCSSSGETEHIHTYVLSERYYL